MRTSIIPLATLVAFTATAHAQVGIVVTGEATVQPVLAAQLETWLHDHGRNVMPGPLEPEAINTMIDCFVLEDLGCARGVVDARSKAKALVFARAEATQNADGTREVAITGYWFQKNHDAIAERRVCKRCNDQSLHATIDELMVALVHEPPPVLDDSHKDTDLEKPSSDDDGGRRSRMVPIALMAVGGAAILGGAIAFAFDEDDVASPKGSEQPQNYTDTAPIAIGAIVGGIAVAGVGGYLFWKSSQTAPTATTVAGGAVFGLRGSF